MTAEYKNWQEEFVDINFTDQRLKSRFFKIIDAFAASPGKSTWAATGSRSSAKAAYRFFSNSEISKDELLDSISRATVEKIKCADLQILLPEKMVYRNGKEVMLNRHEFDILVYLARHPGWVRSKEQIYEAVWTEDVMNYENAVMWCISQLRKKLEPDPDRLQYIHTVKRYGLQV